MVRFGVRLLVLAALAAAFSATSGAAQTGRITGTVRDFRGVAMSGAVVTVTNQSTGATSRATTAANGTYTVSDLAPGTYTAAAALLGLRRMVQQNVQVTAGATVTLDFALQPLVLDAITVTAMLREQELVDVPFSIAAPTEQELRLRGVNNIEEVATQVAGLSVQNLGPGQSTVAIRGASSGQIARDQPGVKEQVSSYLDDSPVSLSLFTPDLDLFDVARVEVLRGPQGTLFGAGSQAGTVRYITNQPELGLRSTFGEVGGGWIDGGAPGSSAKLGFNVPLGEKATARVVGYSTRTGGYMDAVRPNLKLEENVNGMTRSGARAAVRLVPSDRFSITPRVVYQRVHADGWNRIDAYNILGNPYTTTRPAVTLGERELFTQIPEPYDDEFLLSDINLQANFGAVTLTSISSFTYRDILVRRDAGALTSSITGSTPLTLPETIYALDAPLDDHTLSRVWTQELRLGGGSDRVRWLVGGFFSKNDRHYGQSLIVARFDELSAPILGAPPGFTQGLRARVDELFFSDLSYNLKQYAAFGEATLAAGPRLSLTAGLRYYKFDEDRAQIFDGLFGNDDNGNSLVSQPGTTDADGVAPRFIASYQVSDALTVNAQASKGFRLGGINDPLNVPLCTPEDLATYQGRDAWLDEKTWNYEVGIKSRLAGGRASFNASAFYQDIRDIQLTVTAGSCSSRLILNVDKARSQGLEAELTAVPNEHLDVSVGVTFTNSELLSTFVAQGGDTVPGIVKGNRLPSVPEVQGTAALTYQWQVGTASRAFISGSFQHIGSRYTTIGDFANNFGIVDLTGGAATIGGPLTQSTFTFDPLLPAYSLVNLRVGLIRDAWEFAIYVNNVTDERAFLALDQERGSFARVGYLTNQPRTAGFTLRFAY